MGQRVRDRSKWPFIWLGVGTAAFLLLAIGLTFLAFAGAAMVDWELLAAVFLAIPGFFLCKWSVELLLRNSWQHAPEVLTQSGGKPVLPLAIRIFLGTIGIIFGLLGVCGFFGIRDPILLPLFPLLFLGLYLLRLAERRTPAEALWLLVPPFILVEANGDITFYRSVDSLARTLEPVDVRNEGYRVFDSLGNKLELKIERDLVQRLPWFLGGNLWKERVALVRSQEVPAPEELIAALRSAMAAVPGAATAASAQLEELIALAMDQLGLE